MRCRSHDEDDEDEGEQEAGKTLVTRLMREVPASARMREPVMRKPEMAKKPTTPQLPRCCPAASKSPPGPGKDIRMGVEDHEGQDEPEQVEGAVAGPEVTGSE